MNQEQYVLYKVSNRIGDITLNRPDKRNALNYSMVADLKAALIRAIQDPSVKVIRIKGEGKAFCAGADLEYLKRLQAFSQEENLNDSNHLKELFEIIYHSPKMVVAQIQGHALAGGAGLATVCDFAFSVPEAKFGYTEVRIGFIPAIVMIFLLRKIGETRAKELLLSGEIITAERAAEINMINRVIPADEIEDFVQEFLETLCKQNSGQSMEITKKMIGDVQTFPVKEGLNFAARMNAHARATEDCKKGISAFLNKESMEW